MDVSIIEGKVNSIDNVSDLEAYQSDISKIFQGSIDSLNGQISQLASLSDPATFIVNFISMISNTVTGLTAQLSDLQSNLNTINSLIEEKKKSLNK